MDNEIIIKTIELKQQRKRKLLDTIIASTAIVHDIMLATRNTEDFEDIPELRVFNPFEK